MVAGVVFWCGLPGCFPEPALHPQLFATRWCVSILSHPLNCRGGVAARLSALCCTQVLNPGPTHEGGVIATGPSRRLASGEAAAEAAQEITSDLFSAHNRRNLMQFRAIMQKDLCFFTEKPVLQNRTNWNL